MLNFNGEIIAKSAFNLPYNNRAFSYGDSLFDTCKFINDEVQFIEDHYFRLMASMRMLRMEIPMSLTLTYFEQEIRKTITANELNSNARVKFSVFRNTGGFYAPETNQVSFIIEARELIIPEIINEYEVDIFKDYTINSNILSTLKTNNRIVNVVGSIYAKENNLDNCLLINEKKFIVEALNGNVFLIFGNVIKTPAITEGCMKGVMRKKIIEMIKKTGDFVLEETAISPFEIQKADSLFITNSIIGIQGVKKYRKKVFNSYLVDKIKEDFKFYYSEK